LAILFGCCWTATSCTMNEQQQFEWGELTEKWWRDSGASCRATETQIKFACARHQGANKVRAATLAGYSGGPEALRSAGVRAEGTKAVEDLLTLAAAVEDGGSKDGPATPAEIDRKLAKLIRSPDGAISLKAIEVMARRDELRRQRGEAPENDGLSCWRFERDLLGMPNGGSAYLLLNGGILNLRLLHDAHHVVMNEEFGPQLWKQFYERLSDALATRRASPDLGRNREKAARPGLDPSGYAAAAQRAGERERHSRARNNGGWGCRCSRLRTWRRRIWPSWR
jgi:hypothetical protein